MKELYAKASSKPAFFRRLFHQPRPSRRISFPPGRRTQPLSWTYSVTPYFWAAGLSGETSQFGLPIVDIDADFRDIFDNLDFVAMLIGEARNGRYSLFGEPRDSVATLA